ncbi:MupG family TIM beta-alpha barrel fold protein, partial [Bacillus sp. B-TM1]
MRRLGISIYPEHSTVEKDKEYLTLASKYGFTRVFTCLLSVDGEKEKIIEEFKETISHANALGFQVLVDISPAGFGITTTTYGTVVSDLIPQARRGEGMGYFGLSGTIAMALGPLIGLWLMQTYNFTILFLCALSCTIVSLILTKLLQIKKSPQSPQQTSGTFLDGFIERKALLPPYIN